MSQVKIPRASSRLLALTRSVIHISPDNIQQADSTGTWLADVYDAIDYVEALDRAGKVTVDFDESADDFIYGEFDMGFFLGLLARLNPTDDAIFADIGSGRGQLVILAALTRKWRRCVGIEIVPILHEMACAALALVEKEKGDQIRYINISTYQHINYFDMLKKCLK
jgi:tRNA G46 methylase TrmB